MKLGADGDRDPSLAETGVNARRQKRKQIRLTWHA